MKKKGVLIISYRYYPNRDTGAKRFSYLSFLFKKSLKNIHILTIKDKYVINKDLSLPHSGVIHKVGFFPLTFFSRSNLFTKFYYKLARYINPIDNYWGWIIPAIFKGAIIIKKNNISKIIITGPPFSPFISAFFLSKIFRISLILDYRDPWFFNKISKEFLGKKFNSIVEKIVIKQASKVIFNSQAALSAYENSIFTNVLGNKGAVLTNGYYKEVVGKGNKLENNKIVILYAGNLYHDRKISYLFNPLYQLCINGYLDKKDLKIHIFGNILQQDLEELKKYKWNGLINHHSPVSHNEIIKYMKEADILYLPQITYGEYAIPYKIYDYLSVKKPILAITKRNYALEQLINEVSCGEVGYVDDNETIYKALFNILIKKKKYNYKINKYKWDYISKNYLRILENL